MNPAGIAQPEQSNEVGYLRNRVAELEERLLRTREEVRAAADSLRNEAALRLSHEILRQLPDAIIVTDLEGRIHRWQGRAEEIFGYTAEEAIGQPLSFLYRPGAGGEVTARIISEIREKGRCSCEIPCVRKDGTEVPIEKNAKAVYDKNGVPIFLVGINKDITERKAAEERLQKSEMLLAESQAIAHLGSWEWDVREDRISWSEEMFRIFGLMPKEFDGVYSTYLNRVHPDDREFVRRVVADALRTGEAVNFEHRIVRVDGTVRVVGARARVVLDGSGTVVKLVGTGQDITELKKVEQKFRSLLEAAPEAIVICGPDGAIVLVNSETERLFGYRREELLGQQIELLIPETSREGHRKHVGRYMKDPHPRPMGGGLELRARRKDGSEFPAEISLSPLETEEGLLVTSAIRDVSERKKAEEAIRSLNAELERRVEERTAQLQRSNEDLQQFAYVASHDLQEPLRTITSFTQLLAKRYKGKLGADADEFIDHAVNGARRMSSLIDDLLSYSRAINHQITEPLGSADLEGVLRMVQGNLNLAIRESGAHITNDPLPKILGDFGQLMQLMQNLISNAIKYRGEDPPRIHVSAEQDGGEWVISVRDNGIGIDARFNEKIFLPFKRLHGREQPGTGIGLAICKKIVSRHGGRIWVESEEGKGSTFYFTLRTSEDICEGLS